MFIEKGKGEDGIDRKHRKQKRKRKAKMRVKDKRE